MNQASSIHPYSPMVDSSMNFAHAVNSVTNPLNLGLNNQLNSSYGQIPTHTSPAMSYVQTNQYVPPMSPATQSINSSLSSLDPQAQQFALMSGNGMNVNNGYQYNTQSIMGLNQPQMINSINRGLMGMQQQNNNNNGQQQQQQQQQQH